MATSFIDDHKQSKKPQTPKPRAKSTSKGTKRKSKAQADIRKVLSKQEQMFNYAVTENCLEEGIDPEEMQIALAISESLKDQTNQQDSGASTSKFDNPFTSMGKVQPISAVLERFGFKCKKNYSEYEIDLITNSKFAKRSKFQKFPTELTRTSNEKRNEIIRTKIDKILEQNSSQEPIGAASHNYEVFSFYLQDLYEQIRTVFMMSRDEQPADETFLNYYVTELFEPSFVKAGHMLKDWSKIAGRDPTPERTLPSSEHVSAPETEDQDDELLATNADEEKVITDTEDDDIEHENATATSCMDIFANLEDFDHTDSEHDESCVQECSLELAGHLSVLQEKLSQSMMEADDNEVNEEIAAAIDVLVQNDEPTINDQEEPETPHSRETDRVQQVDLTQCDSSANSSCATIPYDDSYYSLQQHMKKFKGITESPLASQERRANHNEDPEISLIQIDLLSSEDEKDEQLPEQNAAENISDDEMLMNDAEELILSQNSLDDDELIAISDEEVNYSIRKFHNNNENPSDASSEAEQSKEQTVDLTQEISEPEAVCSQMEVDNHVDQSMVDLMGQQNAFDINDSISNLLHSSTPQLNPGVSRRDRSTKFFANQGLSDSIQDIMRRYGAETSTEKDKSRSFKKMQSDSHLTSESLKTRRSVRFSTEECNVVDLTQPIEDSLKDKSFQLNNFNSSFHQSIENIESLPPTVSRKKVQRQAKLNFKAKRSLGIQLDDDYIVDTETLVSEPDYKNMTPVELKQALAKYGVRSLPVKKALTLLEYIFDQLHPSIRVAADEEIDANDSRREMNITDIVTNIGEQEDDDFVFQVGLVDDEDFVLPKMRKSKVCSDSFLIQA